MHRSPRCGAKVRTRGHAPCRNPAMKGKRRCRMHGGKNEGGKIGNENALKHGRYRQALLRERREIREFIRWCDGVMEELAAAE
jgi:glucans biosynthesis protein